MMKAISRPLHMSESDNREALRKSCDALRKSLHGDLLNTVNALSEVRELGEGNRHERRRAAKLERKQVTA